MRAVLLPLLFLLLATAPSGAQSLVCEAGTCQDGPGTAVLVLADSAQIHYDGAWRDGLPHGEGTLAYPDGTRFTGRLYDGRLREGRIVWPDRSTYHGWIVDDTPHGWGLAHAPDGTSWNGLWGAGIAENVVAMSPDSSRSYRRADTLRALPSFAAVLAQPRMAVLAVRRAQLSDSLDAHGWPETAASLRASPDAVRSLITEQETGRRETLGSYALRHPPLLAQLLDAGADPNATAERAPNLVLHAAILHTRGHTAPLTCLLDAGADPNRYNGGMFTPLTMAARTCSVETVDALLHAGGAPQACAADEPCLNWDHLRAPRAYESAHRARDEANSDERRAACDSIMDRVAPYTDTPMGSGSV